MHMQTIYSTGTRMAGLATTMNGESFRNGNWYLCSDGKVMEPLDILHLFFPNKGRDTVGWNVCFIPEYFRLPFLRNLLPDETEYFLPDDLVDSVAALFYLCVFITVTLFVVRYTWEWLDPQFAVIAPPHKKWYVIANLSKAFFLGCLTFSSRYWIGTCNSITNDDFSGLEVKRTGILYLATDVVSLYMVPKLPRTTILHHITTTTLILLMCSMNMSLAGWTSLLGVCKMAILYGIFSSVSFSVNAYLALRVIYPKAKWLRWLVPISLWLYILLCATNWSVHLVWVVWIVTSWEVSVYSVLYLLAILAIVQDDIVLIKWLWKRDSPMASLDVVSNGTNEKKES